MTFYINGFKAIYFATLSSLETLENILSDVICIIDVFYMSFNGTWFRILSICASRFKRKPFLEKKKS